MEDKKNEKTIQAEETKARRDFLKKAASVAVTAPAVTILLSAPGKSYAGVEPPSYQIVGAGVAPRD